MTDDNQTPTCQLLGCKKPCSRTNFVCFDSGCCEFHTLIIQRSIVDKRSIDQRLCLVAGCNKDRDYENGRMGCCEAHEQDLSLPDSPYDRRPAAQKYKKSKLYEKGG